jgi:hypothetical protein
LIDRLDITRFKRIAGAKIIETVRKRLDFSDADSAHRARLFTEKVASDAIVDDAEELAKYEGLPRGANVYLHFVAKAIEFLILRLAGSNQHNVQRELFRDYALIHRVLRFPPVAMVECASRQTLSMCFRSGGLIAFGVHTPSP